MHSSCSPFLRLRFLYLGLATRLQVVMPQRSVLVTYTLHPSPTPGSSNPIQAALNGIRAQIPLRNLHWKSSSRTALRTIQEVSVTLLELGEAGSVSKEIAGSILDWPLVNLCLVVCEVRSVCMI